jgi:exodeoxyribonuclease-3
MPTTIASWNVNSLNVRMPHLAQWLAARRPDIVALQETKLEDAKFPDTALAELGYRSVFCGQKTYNGVAILSRTRALDCAFGIPEDADPQRRVVAAGVGPIRLVNVYVPNGQAVGSEKYTYKLAWLERLRAYLAALLASNPYLLVVGDFNIAPEDRDVHDPAAWVGCVHVSPEERAALAGIADLGLVDAFRHFEQPEKSFSWWDYRQGAFRRNNGLRIDLILVHRQLLPKLAACRIDVEPRRAERASDHTPVIACFQA